MCVEQNLSPFKVPLFTHLQCSLTSVHLRLCLSFFSVAVAVVDEDLDSFICGIRNKKS